MATETTSFLPQNATSFIWQEGEFHHTHGLTGEVRPPWSGTEGTSRHGDRHGQEHGRMNRCGDLGTALEPQQGLGRVMGHRREGAEPTESSEHPQGQDEPARNSKDRGAGQVREGRTWCEKLSNHRISLGELGRSKVRSQMQRYWMDRGSKGCWGVVSGAHPEPEPWEHKAGALGTQGRKCWNTRQEPLEHKESRWL